MKAYMKVNGIDDEGHKIFSEIERNRTFIKKIKDAEGSTAAGNNEKEGEEPQKKLKLDTAAAMRMIKPHLAQNKDSQDASAAAKSVVRVFNIRRRERSEK